MKETLFLTCIAVVGIGGTLDWIKRKDQLAFLCFLGFLLHPLGKLGLSSLSSLLIVSALSIYPIAQMWKTNPKRAKITTWAACSLFILYLVLLIIIYATGD